MPAIFQPTHTLQPTWVFAQPQWCDSQRMYPGAEISVPKFLSPWDICELFMRKGYLPPFEVVRQLHEEEVQYGDVAKKLWILRGARRTAKVVESAAISTTRQIHELKKGVHRWR